MKSSRIRRKKRKKAPTNHCLLNQLRAKRCSWTCLSAFATFFVILHQYYSAGANWGFCLLNGQTREKESEMKESEDPESAAKPSAPVLDDTEAAGSGEAAETVDTRTVSYFSSSSSSSSSSQWLNCTWVSESNVFDSQVNQQWNERGPRKRRNLSR